jgi:hypothetical protein
VTREKDGSAHDYATGDIVPAYPYLWHREKERGEDSGGKERPVCVTIAMKNPAGLTHLALLAITGSEPTGDQTAVELPALEIRRIGLWSHKRAWVIVSEYNDDILERSCALELPREAPGKLSPGFLKVVLAAFRPVLATSAARINRR